MTLDSKSHINRDQGRIDIKTASGVEMTFEDSASGGVKTLSDITAGVGAVTLVFGRPGPSITADDGDYVASKIIDDSSEIGPRVSSTLDSHGGRITQNETDISTNTGNISTNAGNIGTNTTNIGTNTGNIATNASDISDIQTSHTEMRDATKEPTGFYDPDLITVTYNAASRTVTLTGTVKAMYRNTVLPTIINGWESGPHETTPVGLYFLYYNGTDFIWSKTPWEFWHLQIAAVSFDGASNLLACLREVHGCMPWQSHRSEHQTIGTYRVSGGDVGGYVALSITPSDRRPTVSECVVCDEDLCTTNVLHNTQNDYTWGYLLGTDLGGTVSKGNPEFVPGTSIRLQYNEFTGAVWQLTNVTNNRYVSYWLVAVPSSADSGSQQTRFFWIPGQTQSTTIDEERSLTPQDLTTIALQGLATEYVFIEQVICYQTSNNWYIQESRKLTGTRSNQVAQASGGFLSTVTSDVTMEGVGTAISPLSDGTTFVEVTTSTYTIDSTTRNNTIFLVNLAVPGTCDFTIDTTWIAQTNKRFRVISKDRGVSPTNKINIDTAGSELFNNIHTDVDIVDVDIMPEFITDGTDIWYKE
jgi:hypothetical protein